MRFHQAVTVLEMDQLLPVARASEELGFDGARCQMARGVPCFVDRRLVDTRQARSRQMMATLAHAHPRLVVLDPLEVLCDAQRCGGEIETVATHVDDNHLSPTAGRALMRHFAPLIHFMTGG